MRYTIVGKSPDNMPGLKKISLTETTDVFRFVKSREFSKGRIFSVGYDFPKEWIENRIFCLKTSRANMNDILENQVLRKSGIDYPFARNRICISVCNF